MIEKILSAEEKEVEFAKFIVREYLKYGSVDEVFRKNGYNLPISFMGVHRIIDKWGIVKAAGPNSKLSEAITFLVLLSDKKIPLERLYKGLPPSFKTSMATMHRILHHIKEGMVRRAATVLVISPEGEDNLVLLGEDISTPRLAYGKPFGATTLPMSFSKFDESPNDSVLRVLQQEVFTEAAVGREMPSVIPNPIRPFMYFHIADLKVAIYHISLPRELCNLANFSSYKVRNHQYVSLSDILKGEEDNWNFRAGIREVVIGYKKWLSDKKSFVDRPQIAISSLNVALSELALDYQLFP